MNKIEGHQWIEAICSVQFDLEEGQMIEFVHPPHLLSKDTLKTISNYSFPDSHVFKEEGVLFYFFQPDDDLQINCYSTFTQRKDKNIQ